ncbi:olfactory receptor 6N2-like [Chanos chanos]|uniref:Olfactory receptor n=1 Tax=Chanos chanos TaxID=29144 RepID=A0A6J2VNJ2_CHACN|nr:olfactory receptor 6N2-like [Chanos chanos]
MGNGSNPTYFYFVIFENQGYTRYIFFILGLTLYLTILIFNVIILLVIYVEKMLHRPMYLLISCLSFNSLYGTAGLFPRLLTDLLSDVHTISPSSCHIQTFVIYTYASCEFTILTLMAYDRYVAICKPLQYHSIMTPSVLIGMTTTALFYPMFCFGSLIVVSSRLQLCGNEITKLYCSGLSVLRLSCEEFAPSYILSFIVAVTTVFIPMVYILYSYIRILIICQRRSSEFKAKAFHTCLPHIVTFVNYSIAVFCEMIITRYEPWELPEFVIVILSLEFLIVPPVLNPLVYGLSFLEIRKKINNYLRKNLILKIILTLFRLF